MLCYHKKSKYNLYEQLDYLGLNFYEQKYFCFHGSTDGDESGDTSGAEAGSAFDDDDTDLASADPSRGSTNAEQAEADARAQDAMSQLADQLSLAQEEAMSARSAAEKAAGLQSLMDMGIIGYTGAVERGFVDAVERAERDFDVALAYDIAAKYGLDPSQVQPGFMQDPAYGPQTMSYRGPGARQAAFTEVAKAASELAVNLKEMYPSPLSMALKIAEDQLGIKTPSLGLKEGISDYFDQLAASQREANIAARGETDPDTAGIIDDVEEEDAQQGAFSTSGISGVTTASDTATGFGDIDLDGNEFIPLAPAIPSVPSVAPQPAAEVVRPPVTRTAAADNFSILVDTYGPEVAAQLLPNRIV